MAQIAGRFKPCAERRSAVTERSAELRKWLAGVVAEPDLELVPASSDASFRRYFRVHTAVGSRIVMDAPPDRESVQRFVQVASVLARAGVHVPEILASDPERGFLLLGDLGEQTYLQALENGQPADPLYADALDTLLRLQHRAEPDALPLYDRALLERELGIFREWFLERHLGLRLDDSMVADLQAVNAFLVDAALAQPRTVVHRDYHSRNLMVTDPNPGVLDFQDAVVGPIAYDLVSLLRDCYVAWPAAKVTDWVREYHGRAAAVGLPVGTPSAFARAFDLVGVQRHLKAIGIFARLWHRDGKRGYLGDIPRVLDYVQEVVLPYRELNGLRRLIEREVLPRTAA
jgi:aminoglycoside/choline kinase family phosphotransferase